jgi:hypothetical protein
MVLLMKHASLALLFFIATCSQSFAHTLFSSTFDGYLGTEGFYYKDDTFRGTTQSSYASGRIDATNGYLEVNVGGIDYRSVYGISGGWVRDFTLPQAADVVIKLYYELTMSDAYESDEFAQALCTVDGKLVGSTASRDYIGQTGGWTKRTSPVWVTIRPGILQAGKHQLIIGAYNNKKTSIVESSRARFYAAILEYSPIATRSPTRSPVKPTTKAPTRAPIKPLTKSPTKAPVKPLTKSPTKAPVKPLTKAPTKSPTKAPVKPLTKAPTKSPTKAPAKPLTKAPTKSPTKAPVKPLTKAPTKSPTKAPIKPLTKTPTKSPSKAPIKPLTMAPTKSPTNAPVKPLTKAPTLSPTQAPEKLTTKAPTSAPIKSVTKSPTSGLYVARINAGSVDTYVDPDGEIWEADNYFEGKGGVYGQCPMEIAGTESDGLYCKERYFNTYATAQPFQYNIPVPRQGAYTVKLHFAEIYYKTANERVFDIMVNGKLAMKQLDIVAKAGPNTALVIPITTQITGTSIVVELVALKGNPKICALEVMELTDYVAPPTSAPIAEAYSMLINCGGNSFVEAIGGRRWNADQYFIGGNSYIDGSNPINQTLDYSLYQTERYGEFKYEIPVPVAGSYNVILHFAELYWTDIGQRLFNIDIESTATFENFDIVAYGNGQRLQAITLESLVTVDDGYVSIQLSNSVPRMDNPKLSGIEIIARI